MLYPAITTHGDFKKKTNEESRPQRMNMLEGKWLQDGEKQTYGSASAAIVLCHVVFLARRLAFSYKQNHALRRQPFTPRVPPCGAQKRK